MSIAKTAVEEMASGRFFANYVLASYHATHLQPDRIPRTSVRIVPSLANLRSPLGLVPAEARLTGYLAFKRNRQTPSPSAFRRRDGDYWATIAANGRPRPRLVIGQ